MAQEASDQRTIQGRSKMKISRSDLYRIIVEEYAREEGAELSEDRVDDLLAWIKGGPKPKDLDYDKATPPAPKVPEKEDSDTFIMDAPAGGDMSDEEIVASISQMIQGRDPEHVSELFQAVFAQIPGVEMGDAEEEPESLYSPGAEGRPQVGFRMEELVRMIREVLNEGAPFHDMYDDYVPFETELAQKVVDAGGRADEATMSVKPEELEKQLWEWLEEAAHDVGRVGPDELKDMHGDVVERILEMQADNEDV